MDLASKTLLVIGFVKQTCKVTGVKLFPTDISKLLILWLYFGDRFDEKLTNKQIKIENIQDENYGSYQKINLYKEPVFIDVDRKTAICQKIVTKGLTEKWSFKFDKKPHCTYLVVGIVDDETAQKSAREMDDFSLPRHGGYGLMLDCGLKYHETEEAPFKYAQQFEYQDNHLVTMILDLSQEKNKKGVLSFIMHSAIKQGVDINEYSNILYDNIDVNKKWRAAIAIYDFMNDGVSLLP